MASVERILVVGGGIAGLTFAAALHQRRLQVELVERSPAWHAVGAGILLHANGMRVLRALGMATAVEQAGTIVQRWGLSDQQGELLCNTDLAAMWKGLGPCVGIERTRLQDVLVAGAAAVSCRLGVALTSLRQDDGRVAVGFSDGSSGEYDLVVGADGISSTVRELALTTPPPSYTGGTVWRSLVPRRPRRLANMNILLGDDRFFGQIPMGDDHTYGFAFLVRPRAEDPVEGRLERIRQQFADFSEPVAEYLAMLEADAQLHCSPIQWLEPGQWYTGRVVLIGDAAHASPPSMTQGGALAMEDAYVLAEVLQSSETVERALERYIERCRPRATWVQQHSRAQIQRWVGRPEVRNPDLREHGDRIMHEYFAPLVPMP
jgi:2-polyprenyl-6-methoxyphenol hydroxylase-like FAD-dependent oxidoreductase